MKLLVLAQIPPPLHGQSLMVRTLVEGIGRYGVHVRHVPLALSRDTADIGRLRPGKWLAARRASLNAEALVHEWKPDALYYVPAPGKRGALWRDILVLRRLRRTKVPLVLHYHASGLGEWLRTRATGIERALAFEALGRAALAITLTHSLRADAAALKPLREAVVANGIPPLTDHVVPPPSANGRPQRVLFIGAVTAAKGAGLLLHAVSRLRDAGHEIEVTFAGDCPEPELQQHLAACGEWVRRLPFVSGAEKLAAFNACDCVCLPTSYPHEAQPLVALEALSAGRPVVATRWRGLPDTLPPGSYLAEPGDAASLAAALRNTLAQPPAASDLRAYFDHHYTIDRHLAAMTAALKEGVAT